MDVNVYNWPIKKIWKIKEYINEQPEYQRGEVWNDKKKGLLIDSILRGIDIPKIYLRKLANDEYEVADGQQRITSIIKFKNNDLKLSSYKEKGLDLSRINGIKIGGQKYDQLPIDFRNKFDEYKLTIAIVENTSGDEIRTLFGRLQEGVNLNPPEKRNAIISHTGRHIDNFVLNHPFFENSKISPSRFKRQDYLAHVVTLIAYNNKEDLKADLILKLYLDQSFKLKQDHLKQISDILDLLMEVDQSSNYRIYKKFHFIDLFWLFYLNYGNLKNIKPVRIAQIFDDFEEMRLSVEDPKLLIERKNPSQDDQDLYDYYMAFRYNGSAPESIKTRSLVYNRLFQNFL